MLILDAHVHIGENNIFDAALSEEVIERFCDDFGVDGGIVQPFTPRPYIKEVRYWHDRIAAFCNRTAPRKHFWGMASINPHFYPEEFDEEAIRCIRDLRFVGLKINTLEQACFPSSKDAYHVYAMCRELKVPLMIHTGNGIPLADPIQIYQGAKDHPDVPVIVAHAGTDLFSAEAILLAKQLDNVFLEPSWCSAISVMRMYRELGADKLMFSTDNPHQLPVELAKYRQAIKNEDDLEKVMWKNVVSIYRLRLGA